MKINESEYTVKTDALPMVVQDAQVVDAAEAHDTCPEEMTAQGAQEKAASSLKADGPSSSSRIASAVRTMVQATSLAEVVRLCGAGMIVFALSLFLMQGVDATNDLQRFHLLLLQTGLLGAAGFAVGYILKEPRGARVFFSLGLLSIPANLTVLGAMIYSVVHAGELTTTYPEYANWQASNLKEIAIATATGAFVLVPMALFSFSVFARQSRGWLAMGYLLGSMVLLVPVRSTFTVAIMAGLVAVALMMLIRRQQASRETVLTGEERFCRILLFLPPVLMLVRSATLYSSEFSMLVTLASVSYLVLRYCSRQFQTSSWFGNTVHLVTALAATCLAALLCSLVAINGLFSAVNLAFCLVLGCLLLDLSRLVPSSSVRWWMHVGWATLCIPAFFANHVLPTDIVSITMTLLVCGLMIASGVVSRNRLVMALGLLALVGNVLGQGRFMTSLLFTSNWMTLAAVGAAIVIAGSMIERYGVVGKMKMQAWMKVPGSAETDGASVGHEVVIDPERQDEGVARQDMAA